MINDVWLPAAIRMGIPVDVFWQLNPKYMYMYQDNYIKEKQEQMKMLDVAAFYQGLYVQQAIVSCFDKKSKYPKKPLSIEAEEKKKLENMSEQEYYASVRAAIEKMNRQFKEPENE